MPSCDGRKRETSPRSRIELAEGFHALEPELEVRSERPQRGRDPLLGQAVSVHSAAVGTALILLLALTAALGWQAWHLLSGHLARTRGIAFGDPPQIRLAGAYPLGVNTSLEAYGPADLDRVIDLAQADGVFLWARQTFPWSAIEPDQDRFEWEAWDRIVSHATAGGLRVIAVLDTSPVWARTPFDAANSHAPPENFEDYFRFAAAVAERYGDRIDHYQVWDQPNIYPHWGERSVDPAGYENLLLGAYNSIRGSDPGAVVLSAGLAPNVERGGRNMSDLAFLQKMYDAGAGQSFDVLAIKPYGFWWGPEDRRAEPEITNFSRAILAREVMARNQDGDKPVWAVELGWNSLPPGWSGVSPPWGSDSEAIQADRTVRALERGLSEWPWLGALILEHLDPLAAEDDPRHGFALLGEDLAPRLTYRSVVSWGRDGIPLFPGRYGPDAWAVNRSDGLWKLEFFGTRLDLLGTSLQVRTRPDERESIRQGTGRVTLIEGLASSRHRAEFAVEGGSVQTIVVARDGRFRATYAGLALLGAATLLLSAAWVRLVGLEATAQTARGLSEKFFSLPDGLQGGLVAAAALLLQLSPWLPLDLAAVGALGAGVALRPDWGLALVSFSLPFFLWGEGVVGGRFALTENLVLLIAAGAAARWASRIPGGEIVTVVMGVFERPVGRKGPLPWRWGTRLSDLGVLGLVALGGISLLWSGNLGVALREFRVVILGSSVFYFLIRSQITDEARIWRLVDALVAGAVAVSLVGLAQLVAGQNLIEAEGVRRIRATYGSPNNLALYLGRIIPLVLAVVWLGPKDRQRPYFLSLAPLMVAGLLTFSRGLWFLGLPASVLFLGAARGRRALAGAVGAVTALLLVLLLLPGGQRLADLANPQAETTVRRIALWQASVEMLQDHPLTGVGLDNFLYQYPRYILPEARVEPELSHPHNLVLHWWLSLGIVAMPLLAGILLSFFKRGLRVLQSAIWDGPRALALGLLASMVYVLAHGAIDQSFFLVDLAFVFMLTLAVMRKLEDLAAPYQG
ncbi:MAG: O-antigen ligase family protein [Anaerolineae bacterium]